MKVYLKWCLGLQTQWIKPADMALCVCWAGAGQGHNLEDTRVSAFREGRRGTTGYTHAHAKLHVYLTVCDNFFRNATEIAFPL